MVMVNRCKFLNPTLNVCSEIGQPCSYMADPHSCSMYDEELERPYQSHPSWAPEIEAPPISSFADRVKAELNGLGVKVEEEEIEEAPDWF